jgi:hypothetical protein
MVSGLSKGSILTDYFREGQIKTDKSFGRSDNDKPGSPRAFLVENEF